MTYKIKITEGQAEDFVISAKEQTPLLEKIEALLSSEESALFGFAGGDTVRLSVADVQAVVVEAGKVYALTDGGKWQLRERLYQMESDYPDMFLKINQSCLINPLKIDRFKSTVGGALLVVLKCGYRDYVSRRQLKTVKERMGI